MDESSDEKDPVVHSLEIALRKAHKVTESLDVDKPTLVVSADTIVFLDQKILGKPTNIEDARSMLLFLSGRTHLVCTSFVIRLSYQGKWIDFTHTERTEVSFSKITDELLSRYLKTCESLDKAGSYGIQGAALTFIKEVKGCYSNVVGFPLNSFHKLMEGEVTSLMGWTKPWQEYF